MNFASQELFLTTEANERSFKLLMGIASGQALLETQDSKTEPLLIETSKIFALGGSISAAYPYMRPASEVSNNFILSPIFSGSTVATLSVITFTSYCALMGDFFLKRKIKKIPRSELPLVSHKARTIFFLFFGTVSQTLNAVISYFFNKSILWALVPALVSVPTKTRNLIHIYQQLPPTGDRTLYRARLCVDRLLKALRSSLLNRSASTIHVNFTTITSSDHIDFVSEKKAFYELIVCAITAYQLQQPKGPSTTEKWAKTTCSMFALAKSAFEFYVVMEWGRSIIYSPSIRAITAAIATAPNFVSDQYLLRKVGSRVVRQVIGGPGEVTTLSSYYPRLLLLVAFFFQVVASVVGSFGIGYIVQTAQKFDLSYTSPWGALSVPATIATALTGIYLLSHGSNHVIDTAYRRLGRNPIANDQAIFAARVEMMRKTLKLFPSDQIRRLFSDSVLNALACNNFEGLLTLLDSEKSFHSFQYKEDSSLKISPKTEQTNRLGYTSLPGEIDDF